MQRFCTSSDMTKYSNHLRDSKKADSGTVQFLYSPSAKVRILPPAATLTHCWHPAPSNTDSYRLSRTNLGEPVGGNRRWIQNSSAQFPWQQKSSIRAIQNVKETVAVGLEQRLSRLTLPVHVRQNRRLGRVPIEHVVRSELVVPLELSDLDIQRQD